MSSLAKRRVEEFHLRHGGICFELDGMYWYVDGASRDAVDLMGALVEPPSLRTSMTPDRLDYDLAAAKLKFYEAQLATAVREFNELQEQLYFSPPSDEKTALKKLEALKTIVEARNKEVRQAQNIVDATRLGKARKDAGNQPQAETARIGDWRTKMQKIRI